MYLLPNSTRDALISLLNQFQKIEAGATPKEQDAKRRAGVLKKKLNKLKIIEKC